MALHAFRWWGTLAYVGYDLAHLAAHGLAPFPFASGSWSITRRITKRANEAYGVTQPGSIGCSGRLPDRGTIAEHIAIRVAAAEKPLRRTTYRPWYTSLVRVHHHKKTSTKITGCAWCIRWCTMGLAPGRANNVFGM